MIRHKIAEFRCRICGCDLHEVNASDEIICPVCGSKINTYEYNGQQYSVFTIPDGPVNKKRGHAFM